MAHTQVYLYCKRDWTGQKIPDGRQNCVIRGQGPHVL
jgi:hypothetical protein